MNLAQCRFLHLRSLRGQWVRALHPKYQANPLGTAHTPTHQTRFNPGTSADPGFEILYLAEDPTVALFEVQVEPQVYDVLVPPEAGQALPGADGRGILRIAFDPEAVPEHIGSQLASFGTPLVDRMLADAIRRGRFAELYVVGLNLTPHDLAGRARRALTFGADHTYRVERVRSLHFTQAIYFFQATFVSDQKEQEIVPVGLARSR